MLIYRGRKIFLTASEMLKHVARMEHRVIQVLDYFHFIQATKMSHLPKSLALYSG